MLTLILLLLPFLGSLVLFLFRPRAAPLVALIFSAAEWIASIVAVGAFIYDERVQFELNVPWISSLGVNFHVGIDGVGLPLVLLTTTLVPLIILSCFPGKDRPSSFYALMLVMQAALVGVFTSFDGLLFYLFWEMALVPIYFICLIWGGENRGQVTLKFFIYTLAGSLLMLVGMVYLYLQTPGGHSFDLQALYQAGRSLPGYQQEWIFWALFIAFAIKMPVFPFHTWQPDTYTVAPVQGTMLLSGIMLKMGIYGLIRWLIPVVPAGVSEWGFTAVILSTVGIIYASFIALTQKDLKRLVAYSSIAHVGLISAGLMTLKPAGVQGAMIQMLSHGIVVFGLFYIIDIIEQRTRTRLLSELGGIRNSAPLFTTAFVITMLASVALPLTSGFVGEFLLINSLFQYHSALGTIAGLTIILGAVYMFTAFQKAMSGQENERTAGFTDLSPLEKAILYPVVVLVIAIGVFPSPILDISEPAVTFLLNSLADAMANIRP